MAKATAADGMLEAVRGASAQIRRVLREPAPAALNPAPERLLVLGTGGGSAMAGELLRRVLDRPGLVPADVCGEYRPPAWTGRGTLVLAASHSGNTKETLAAVEEAWRRGARVAVFTAGGRLGALARERAWPVWPLTPGVMPRALLYEILAAMLRMLGAAGLFPGADEELAAAAKALARGAAGREREAAAAARALAGRIPYIFGAEPVGTPCGQRLKNQLGENGKLLSFAASLPRAHHDEIVGWSQPEALSKRFGVVLLRDGGEEKEIQARFAATKALLRPKVPVLLELKSEGRELLSRLLTLCQTCDFLSVHAALRRGVAPTPVPIIDDLKRAMGQGS